MIPFNKPYLLSGNETQYIEQQVVSNSKISKKEILLMSFLFVAFFFIYAYLTFFASSDKSIHALFARKMQEGAMTYPGNFIFYGLTNILSFCLSIFNIGTPSLSRLSVSILLALATTYKFHWVYRNIFQKDFGEWSRFLLALSLIFVVAIPIPSVFVTGNWYLGNFTPNIWHNSTTIFLFPFALMLFTASIKQIEAFSNRVNWWILLLVFLNIFIKPSYFFVWICVYPLFLLAKYRLTANFLKGLIPAIIGFLLLVVQYFYIFHFSNTYDDILGTVVYEESSVVIKPFLAYSILAPISMLPLALLFSMLFPLLYLFLNFKRLMKNTTFLFVYVSIFVAFAIYLLFIETGIRQYHGNFYWQIVVCVWLCFFISLSDLLKNKKQLGIKLYLSIAIYMVHVIAGIAYLGRYIFTGNYF